MANTASANLADSATITALWAEAARLTTESE